ncbi:MAG: type II toxin-antitoxin system RatA family toxin [Rhodocyclaceae bacterium]
MAAVNKLVLIEHPAERMFDLVDRVEDYPLFLPWCISTRLIQRTEAITSATLHVSYRGIRTQFSTENDKEPPRYMRIRLVDGPFHHLLGSWSFTPLGETACKIEFSLSWAFSNKMLERALGPVFGHIANTLMDSFVERANRLHL